MAERKLRSHEWFGKADKDGFLHRSWMKNQGLPGDLFDGRPVIGICNTWSELTPCNAHFRELAEKVKRGVYEAGGMPAEFPVMSLGESNLRPTAMLFRNLVSMDVEESIRANPIDGVVLLTGCDKTTPALLMGAASCDLPTIVLSGGPMLTGRFRGQALGSGTDVFKFSEELRAGSMSPADFADAESGMSRSPGHCMTMGTASTMASMAEALGIAMAGNAAIPAVDSRRNALAQLAGRRAVALVREDIRISQILTRQAFENAIRVNGAIGGSTNAVVHLLAIAGRLGVPLSLDDWDTLGRSVPTIVNLMPSGQYLMEDFYYAGGLPAVIRRLGDLIHTDAPTVNGNTVGENCADAPCHNDDVILPLDRPFAAQGGITVLRGNLAPSGAVLKPSAATPADAAPGPRRRLRDDRGLQGAHRPRRSRCRRKLRARPQELRAARLPRHGRGRQHGPAEEASQAGRPRHGAGLRRAHERHRLRHRRPAHGARGRGRRSARACEGRRHD